MISLRQGLSDEQLSRGFEPATDIFHHKDLADRLNNLLSNVGGSTVCLLDGRWGTGKSTFVKQWRAELEKSGQKSIYFDAFASDYVDTPFTALAGIFIRAAHELKVGDAAVAHFIDKAAKIGKALAASSAKIGIKVATLGALDGSEIDGLAGAIADGLGDIAEANVKKVLEEHAERESQFAAMRLALEELTNSLRGMEKEGVAPPLLIFIDELDRCRPDFSLGILEIIKHFFNVSGAHFILITSKRSLELAVDGRYGPGVSSSEYLEKFYDFVVLFENKHERGSQGSIDPFLTRILDRFVPEETSESHDFKDAVREVCIAYRLSLRQIENVCINACLGFVSVKSLRIFKPGILIVFAALVKSMNLEMYRNMREGSLSWSEVDEFLNRGSWRDPFGDRMRSIMQWHFDGGIDANSQEWSGYRGFTAFGLGRLQTMKYICTSIVDRFAIGPDG